MAVSLLCASNPDLAKFSIARNSMTINFFMNSCAVSRL
jgi:hypothetical protein